MWFQTVGSTVDICIGCTTRHGGSLKPLAPGGAIHEGSQGILASRRSATASSSGCDSFYNRHSPHRRCYMLRSLPHAAKKTQETPVTSKIISCDKNKIRKHSVLSVQSSAVTLHSNGLNQNNSFDDKQVNA